MSYSDEFPLLEGVGLYTSDISGDGNCLFHTLSDQLHRNGLANVDILNGPKCLSGLGDKSLYSSIASTCLQTLMT